ncbi:hypothetical protein [Microcoleus sp. B13-B4]|uniref:hypothetical protein n=1 Tax=Microcoleus sp. B13-B4 TaxID=2818651 RepID=UPI002FD53D04
MTATKTVRTIKILPKTIPKILPKTILKPLKTLKTIARGNLRNIGWMILPGKDLLK